MTNARYDTTIFVLVLTLFLSLVSSIAVNDDLVDQCVRAARRQFPLDSALQLCTNAASGIADGPAQCAAAASRASFVRNSNADFVSDIIELCEDASGVGAAECWILAMSSQSKRSKGRTTIAVNVCKGTGDMLAAKCLLEFKRHGLPMIASTPQQASVVSTATQICRGFRGDVAAIGICLMRAPRSLPESSRYELCQYGNVTTVPDVINCAKHLLQRITRVEMVARVCAKAQVPINQPQMCVLAAQQQLRWMDTDAIVRLCEFSQATAAPVHCAVALRSWYIAQFGRDHSFMDLAQLCHRAMEADNVVNCAKQLPSQLFQADQVVRLCGREDANALVQCVLHARHLLFGLSSHYADEDAHRIRSEQAVLLLTLCEDAQTSTSSLECVVSTATHSPAFSAHERAKLCQQSTSTMPYQCYRAIHAAVLGRFSSPTADGISLCQAATSIAPATCINQLLRHSSTVIRSNYGFQACKYAVSTAPADCYAAAPHDFSDHEKTRLCSRAESIEPVGCAKHFLPRVFTNEMKATLCSRAMSTGPARCANASPFGMSGTDIISLCHLANDDKPAQCALAVPPHLRIPWRDIAWVCQGATSTTPGSCLVHQVRRRVPIDYGVLTECRNMIATASSIEIVQFAYECVTLVPQCLISLRGRVVDQFGDEMPTLSHGYVQFVVIPDLEEDAKGPLVRGNTVAPIVNGSVLFRGLYFTIAGNYTLRLSAPGVEDMIARLQIYTNETERREREHCDRIFSFMQCSPPQPSTQTSSDKWTIFNSEVTLQILQLSNRFVLAALQCESMWAERYATLKPLGTIATATLYALPRTAYQLLTGHDIPTASMSAWACLGIPEGSNRSAIRRAYHKRSLEWHPDKWSMTGSVLTTAALRNKVEEIYARINAAYQELLKNEAIMT